MPVTGNIPDTGIVERIPWTRYSRDRRCAGNASSIFAFKEEVAA